MYNIKPIYKRKLNSMYVAQSCPSLAASDSRSRSRSGGTAVMLRGLPSSVSWYRLLRELHGPCGSSARAHRCPHRWQRHVLICSWCWHGAMDDTCVVMNVFIIYLQRRAHASRRLQ